MKSFFIKKILYKYSRKLLINYNSHYEQEIKDNLLSCGSGVSIGLPVFVSGHKQISLGKNVSINAFVHIWGQGGVTIGDDCLIASHVTITSLTHNPKSRKFGDESIGKAITIGANVWIGTHAMILPGVTIGNNVIIGAGSLVNKDLASNAAYAGTPAKKLYDLSQFKDGE